MYHASLIRFFLLMVYAHACVYGVCVLLFRLATLPPSLPLLCKPAYDVFGINLRVTVRFPLHIILRAPAGTRFFFGSDSI